MLEYESLRPLFEFLVVRKNSKNTKVIILARSWQNSCTKR
jgi:hypothetical protein